MPPPDRLAPPIVSPVIDRVARFGFAAKGMIALMIGALALRLALGRGGGLVGPEDALEQFFVQPYGRFTLAILSLGLWAHAIWSTVQAVLDPERKGTGFVAVMERLGFGVTGLGYALLGTAGVKLLFGARVGGAPGLDALVARVLAPHLGRTVVAFLGAIVVFTGILQLRLALTGAFEHIFAVQRMSAAERAAMRITGRLGYAALATMSATIGWFLIRAALSYDPSQAGGWREALGFLATLGREGWVLGAVATGILCYGLYHVLQAHFRRL
jgi:hypothetical protein